jgi:hypothetical protein
MLNQIKSIIKYNKKETILFKRNGGKFVLVVLTSFCKNQQQNASDDQSAIDQQQQHVGGVPVSTDDPNMAAFLQQQ